MRRLTLALGVMAAVLLVAGVSAQNKKDFNGKWTLDPDKSGPAPAAATGARPGGAPRASDFTVTMDDKTINISTIRGTNESKMSYKLDGSESKNQAAVRTGGGGTADVVSIAKWDGDKVVIMTKGANGDTKTVYYLDGTDLVREVTNPTPAGGTAPPTVRTYFKKVM